MSIAVWVGNYGTYEVPAHLQDIRITKTGWPDLRFKRAMEILRWVAEVDKL